MSTNLCIIQFLFFTLLKDYCKNLLIIHNISYPPIFQNFMHNFAQNFAIYCIGKILNISYLINRKRIFSQEKNYGD